MRRSVSYVAAATLSTLVLAACGGGDDTSASSSSASSTTAKITTVPAAKVGKMSDIKVDSKNAKAPKVTVGATPFQVNKTTKDVTTPGKGKKIGAKDIAYVKWVVVNGKDGKQLQNTFDTVDVAVTMDGEQEFKGLKTALTGAKVGDTMNVAIPSKEAFGAQGASKLGVGANDTLIFHIKVSDAAAPLDKATGTTVAPKKDLPTVKVTDGNMAKKPATVTMPKKGGKVAPAPKKLVSQELIKGKGMKVPAGATVKVRYTGVLWKNGKMFDGSVNQGGTPADFPLQQGQMIPGFIKGLQGKTVGSRVLLVLPPAEGYGKQGQPAAGITGTDTLVFVVDILAWK